MSNKICSSRFGGHVDLNDEAEKQEDRGILEQGRS